MAVDREFGVYSWALQSGGRVAPDDEGDGRVGGGAAGQAPSGGRWTGNRRENKKLEKANMFWNILSANVVFHMFFLIF